MDAWGPAMYDELYKDFVGDPINLANGFIYTLDNRRLVAYLKANRDTIPVVWAKFAEIFEKRYEFDTPNWGTSIERRD